MTGSKTASSLTLTSCIGDGNATRFTTFKLRLHLHKYTYKQAQFLNYQTATSTARTATGNETVSLTILTVSDWLTAVSFSAGFAVKIPTIYDHPM